MNDALRFAFLLASVSVGAAAAQPGATPGAKRTKASEVVLVEPGAVNKESAQGWRKEGFSCAALVLDERFDSAIYQDSAKVVTNAGLGLYYWIEVGRNPVLAAQHPEWMASVGMHDDWLKRFPNAKAPKKNEVAKAFPWVSIHYRETFDAHVERVTQLLKLADPGYRGLLLNDLQGGPASCGCGNLQCRWATDYQVPATGTKLEGDDAAAKFIATVRRIAGGNEIIPIWTTECDHEDLPKEKGAGEWTTGYSGTVGCAIGRCPKDFTKQWSALTREHRGNVGLLALHREMGRVFPEYGDTTGWIKRTVDYVERTLPQNGGTLFPRERLWLVVQGYDVSNAEEKAARRTAANTGASVVVVARTRIDQSYEPRNATVKEK